MKRLLFLLFICIVAARPLLCALDIDQSFDRITKIQEEMKFWEEEFKRLEKQKQKGNVSKAYTMMLNAALTQMQQLRKEALQLIDEAQKEEERMKKEQQQAENPSSQGSKSENTPSQAGK